MSQPEESLPFLSLLPSLVSHSSLLATVLLLAAFTCFVVVVTVVVYLFCITCPRGLILTWWGCYRLCLRYKPTELAHSFYSALLSVSVFMALSTVFHSMNSPDNPLLSLSVLLVLISALLVLATVYLFMKVSLTTDIIFCG